MNTNGQGAAGINAAQQILNLISSDGPNLLYFNQDLAGDFESITYLYQKDGSSSDVDVTDFTPVSQIARFTTGFNSDIGEWPTGYQGLKGESMNFPNWPTTIDADSRFNIGQFHWYSIDIQLEDLGIRYKVFKDNNNITDKMYSQDQNPPTTTEIAQGLPLEKDVGTQYKNWSGDFKDLYPNGFPANRTGGYILDFKETQLSTDTITVYFVGWETIDGREGDGGIEIVQDSIRFTPPDLSRTNYEY